MLLADICALEDIYYATVNAWSVLDSISSLWYSICYENSDQDNSEYNSYYADNDGYVTIVC